MKKIFLPILFAVLVLSQSDICRAEINDYAGYWKLDSAGNNAITDSSGNQNHGTYINKTGAASIVAGKVGGAFQFNGSDYVEITNLHGISDIKSGLTIAYWAKRSRDNESYHILKKDAFGSTDPGSNNLVFWTNHESGQDWLVFPTDKITINEWHHIVLTWAAGTKKLYVDGALINIISGRKSDSLLNGSSPLIIGNSLGWAENTFAGALDEVKIYNRALSEREVLDLYGSYPDLICAPGLQKNACNVCKNDGSGWIDDNSKCPSGRVCFAGVCVKKFSCNKSCGGTNCQAGQICVENKCVNSNNIGTWWFSTIKDDEYKYKFHWGSPYDPAPNNYFQIRQKNCDAVLLQYVTPLTVAPGQGNGLNYNYIERYHPEWFLKDSSGNKVHPRIGAYLEESRYLLDIGNIAFQNWAADEILKRMDSYTGGNATGVALDNILFGSMPEFAGKYNQTQWIDIWINYLGKIRYKLNANGYILIGNLGADFRSVNFVSQTEKILDNLDGYMNENFLSFWSIDRDYKNLSENDWLVEINNALWAANQKGKIPVLVSYSYKLPQNDLEYLYGSFLLVNNGKSYFIASPSDVREMDYQGVHYDDFFGFGLDGFVWQSLWDYDLGDPIGKMYKENNVYQRNYTKARIIVNPSANTINLSLGGTYYAISGQAMSSINLSPKTAQILLNYSCARQQKICYQNNVYWQKSCGVKELAQDCGVDLCQNGQCAASSGLLGEWKFDDNIKDSSAYQSDGTYVDSSKLVPKFVSGKTGNAIQFNGSDYVKIPAGNLGGIDNLKNDLTVTYWVKRNSDGESYHILKKDAFGFTDVGSNNYAFWTSHKSGDDWLVFQTDKVKVGEWHHVAFTLSGGIKKFYVDGSLIDSKISGKTGDLKNGSQPMYFGNAMQWSQKNFTGALDEIKVYSHALSASEILELYNSYSGQICVAKTCATLGNYQCGDWADGCGATINCGTCTSGKICSNGQCIAQSGGGGGGGGSPAPKASDDQAGDSVQHKLTRAEILTKIAQIKQLLVQLILQLIAELQKQLSAMQK